MPKGVATDSRGTTLHRNKEGIFMLSSICVRQTESNNARTACHCPAGWKLTKLGGAGALANVLDERNRGVVYNNSLNLYATS